VRAVKAVTLSDFCVTGSGGTPSRSKPERYYEGGTIPWVKSGELRESIINCAEEHVTDAALKESSIKLVPAGAILLAMYGATVGRLGILGIEATTNQAVCHIVPDPKVALTRYVYHALSSKVPSLISMGVGGAQPNINQGIIKSLAIPLPSLPEQRRIAAILDQADALRAKRREALAQLDSLTQSIFIEMFGDPVSNPKAWKTLPLVDGCDVVNDCPHSTPTWTEFGEIGLRTSNLTEGGWNWDDTRYVSEVTYHERSKRGYVTTGDIILSREGTVGIAAIVTSDMKVCMGQRLVQLRPNRSFLSSEFLLRHLLFALSPKRIGQLMVGSTSQHLNVKELKALKIPLPPISLQLEFARLVTSLGALKVTAESSFKGLDNLFASLQHRAFRGDL
jgi:type I restriction enzyme S subunit